MTAVRIATYQKSLPSERQFGLFLAAVFGALSGFGLHQGWDTDILILCVLLGLAAMLVAMITPQLLAPANRAWFHLGELLGRIVSPLMLGILFYGLITPVGLIGRLARRDELRLRSRQRTTYWIDREPPGPGPESFKQQY